MGVALLKAQTAWSRKPSGCRFSAKDNIIVIVSSKFGGGEGHYAATENVNNCHEIDESNKLSERWLKATDFE